MTIDTELLAKEAKRLRDDVFLKEAIERIRRRALDDLVQAKPDDLNEIIAQQMRVKFCSDLWFELEKLTNSGQPKRARSVA